MTITPEQIDVWRTARSETQNLEFKEAKTQFDNTKLYKYCVALANEGGGFLVLGISNKPPRSVVGSAAFNDLVAMTAKLFKAVGFRVEIEEIQHPNGRVVVFHIPSRPKGTAYHFEGSYFMRSGEELVPMSEDQLRKIFAEGQPSWLDEIAKKDLSGQDVIQLLDTQTFFDLLNLPIPLTNLVCYSGLSRKSLFIQPKVITKFSILVLCCWQKIYGILKVCSAKQPEL